MKRLMLLFMLFAIVLPLHALDKTKYKMVPRYNRLTNTVATYPLVTIRDIQYVHPDSLAVADAHQVSTDVASAYWTSQVSSLLGDTVVVVATAITQAAPYDPWFGLTFTAHGWTMLIHDTAANSNRWGGVLVRAGCPSSACGDTAQARLDGFLNVERGDIITITGVIEEFPTQRINSTTQFRPIPGIAVTIEGSGTIPEPTRLTVDSFYVGGYPGGAVNYSDGEAYEGSLIEIAGPLAVNGTINFTRGTWAMTDVSGNYIADYDASHFYTKGNENPLIAGDPSFTLPPIGGVIDTIRGTMLTVSGQENPRGYRICPLYSTAAIPGYSGDVIYGVSLPTVISHRRYPVVVTSTDHASVQARVIKTPGGYDIASAHLFLSINNGAWEDRSMTLINPLDSTYEAIIQDIDTNPYADGTSVKYFIKGIDINGYSQILANSSFSFGNDTSKGFFFYTVKDAQLTIQDVQYTPYQNGRSGYLGGDVALKGIVTADSSDIVLTQTGTFGTTAWYIQNGAAPWSGMWVTSRDSASYAALTAMKRGDSVTVYGSVQEDFDVTKILDSTVVIHASNRPLPAPVELTTAFFGSGNQNMEPYESMLVRIVGSTVSDTAPIFQEAWEFAMDNSGSPMIIRRDGTHKYSNVASDTVNGKTILSEGDLIDTLVGICYYSHVNWKAIPRKNDDIVAGDPYQYPNGWTMLSIGRNQLPVSTGYDKSVLFPTSTSNAFYYDGGYLTASTLQHTLGYWLKFSGAQTIRQLGTKRTQDTVYIKSSWNLIGTLGNPVPTSTITVQPGGNNLSVFFGYAGAYFVEDTLQPSKAYWVKADLDGSFYQESPAMLPKITPVAPSIKEFNTLVISDREGHSQKLYFGQDTEGKMLMRNYEMPPPGPEASEFNVRYASGRILEAYPPVINAGMEFGITINARSAPLKLSWNIVNPQGKRFTIVDAGGKAMKTQEISGTGEAVIKSGGNLQLNLMVNGGSMPKEFALGQNYPNPFNPSTKFEVSLPQAAHLEVLVYNVLGQKVATLANDTRDAGYHNVTWNGTTQNGAPVASGIYFVRMNATPASGGEGFNAVRKIMLMK